MYYLKSYTYVGPHPHSPRNRARNEVVITESPSFTNLSDEPCIDGWCGTTDDVSLYALGAFETEAAARAAAREMGLRV